MKNYLSLIKFSHTIFAMPFALTGFVTAVYSHESFGFQGNTLVKVILCMVFARSAAMAFNRWLDRDIDAKNPRTIIREIPAGIISANSALIFVVINCILFVATTWFINPLCFYLSPVALLVILGYSFTKRFTALCHLVLGLGLSLAPVGAHLAVTGHFSLPPVILGLAVLTWVAGFDIIYALQDDEFDKSHKLYSVPAAVGRSKAMRISEILHVFSACFVILSVYLYNQILDLGWLSGLAIVIFLGMLLYQHLIIRPDDLKKVNIAFFTTNGFASLIFGILVVTDVLI